MHATPPSVEKLSDLFQGFYIKAESHISTHISALSARAIRDASPSSISSVASGTTRNTSKLKAKASKDSIDTPERTLREQQMLTPEEISDRRKARRILEQKRIAMEEAVERRVCEAVYGRIWRHRSTLDEVRDEKLRSRTAALALVGIGLEDLGITFDMQSQTGDAEPSVETQIEEYISRARGNLLKMNEARYPLGKLQHLAAAHKSIVDLLTKLHQSSSSADEILPTLIYTLITTPPEGINVISNLNFTQRFRAESKVDGEAAYCLTNLEAAITFLETVDLASLRSDEPLEGPTKTSSSPSTPRAEIVQPPWTSSTPSPATLAVPSSTAAIAHITQPSLISTTDPLQSPTFTKPFTPTTPSHQRRRSDLLQGPANALEAAGETMRTTSKSISNTLDNSFKVLFGRLKEHHISGKENDTDGIIDANGTVIVPKTLDDARKLVDSKSPIEEDAIISGASSVADPSDTQTIPGPKAEDKLLGLISGRNATRERSVDSMQSSGSGKRVAFASEVGTTKEKAGSPSPAPTQAIPASMPNAAVESMRNLGNTLNPLNRFAGMNLRAFGRSSSGTTPTIANPVPVTNNNTPPTEHETEPKPEISADEHGHGGLARQTHIEKKIAAPIPRFLDVADAGDLRIWEVAELLKDYRRLAGALKETGAFQT